LPTDDLDRRRLSAHRVSRLVAGAPHTSTSVDLLVAGAPHTSTSVDAEDAG